MNVQSEKTVQETRKQISSDFVDLNEISEELKISIQKQNESTSQSSNSSDNQNESLRNEILELKKEKEALEEQNEKLKKKLESSMKNSEDSMALLSEKHAKQLQKQKEEFESADQENRKKMKRLKQKYKEEKDFNDSKPEVIVPKEGWLTKQGALVKSWKRRWFKTEGNFMKYYKNPKDAKEQGIIPLSGSQVFLIDGSQFWFSVNCTNNQDRIFQLKADSMEEMNDWIEHVNLIITKDEREGANIRNSQEIPIF